MIGQEVPKRSKVGVASNTRTPPSRNPASATRALNLVKWLSIGIEFGDLNAYHHRHACSKFNWRFFNYTEFAKSPN